MNNVHVMSNHHEQQCLQASRQCSRRREPLRKALILNQTLSTNDGEIASGEQSGIEVIDVDKSGRQPRPKL